MDSSSVLEEKLQKKKKRKLEQTNDSTVSVNKKKVKKAKLEEETNDVDDEIDEENEVVQESNLNGKLVLQRSIETLSLIIVGSVTNSGGYLTSTSFESLGERGVSESTLKALNDMKLTTMTEIQAKSIGPLLEGR
jgi:hypothetical protein